MTVEQALAGAAKARDRYYTRDGRSAPLRNRDGEKTTIINRTAQTGWPTWCVPTSMLVQFINDHKDVWQSEYTPLPKNGIDLDPRSTSSHAPERLQFKDGEGWRPLLVSRLALTLKVTEGGVSRRLYEILAAKRTVTNAEFAEAVFMSLGKTLDKDGDIPVMPGNMTSAEDLIRIRAEVAAVKLDDLEAKRLAHRTVRICKLIVAYPHNTERLLDLAPLDCLRPYR